MRRGKLERTAYHEAGHTVMAYWLRKRIRYITIVPNTDCQGHLRRGKNQDLHDAEYDRSPRTRSGIEKEVMVAFGGPVAEQILTGSRYYSKGSQGDAYKAADFISYLVSGDKELGAYLKWLETRTEAILNIPTVWQAVKALANELLARKHIGGKAARDIIQDSMKGGDSIGADSKQSQSTQNKAKEVEHDSNSTR